MRSNALSWKVLILVGVLFGLLGAVPVASAKSANPGVIPPQATVRANTYGEWSAGFWQWLLSIPFSQSPFLETQGSDWVEGQTGNVWYLPGMVSESFGPGFRVITVPRGITLFVSIISVECSTVEAPPFFGSNEAALTACAKGFEPTGITAELDGRAIDITADYRATSPLFPFIIPLNDNFLFVNDVTTGQSVADGYYLMLAPLPVGVHILHFTGSYPALGFSLDVTYEIHVVPGEKW